MNKQDFLVGLRNKLFGLPHNDIEERLSFYSEIIDDRIEEGLTEQEAVATIGEVDDVASQIVEDTSLGKIAKQRIKPQQKLKAWVVVLLVVGSPIWLSLILAAVAVAFSIYVSLWAVIISLWSVFVSLVGSSVGSIAGGIIIACKDNALTGIAIIGLGLVCAGLAIFAFFGCKLATKGIIKLTKKLSFCIKSCLMKRGKAK